jgi:transposase-like protein
METQTKKRRGRYSEHERRQLIAAWRESGMSAAAFSEQAGVNKSNLWRWSSEVEPARQSRGKGTGRAAAPQAKSRFIELRVDQDAERPSAAATANGNTPLFEVAGPLGVRVRVYAGVDAETLSRLLTALSAGARC